LLSFVSVVVVVVAVTEEEEHFRFVDIKIQRCAPKEFFWKISRYLSRAHGNPGTPWSVMPGLY
jgi:hypothetical protein